MNEELVAPVFKSISTHWERAFLGGMQSTLDTLKRAVEADLAPFHEQLLRGLCEAGVPDAAAANVHGIRSDTLVRKLEAAVCRPSPEPPPPPRLRAACDPWPSLRALLALPVCLALPVGSC